MNVKQESFGLFNQKPVDSFTISNEQGVEVTCISYGCIITKMMAPDRLGNYENIVLGYDRLEDYLADPYFLGCVVGRVAGRVGGASFELDGRSYSLEKNEINHHLHGGRTGFNRVVWDAKILQYEDKAGVEFSYLSFDGEEGYPGNLMMKVTYLLNNDNEFSIHYLGSSDQTTMLTVTNHSYFNLSGNLQRDILAHSLRLKSNQFMELDEEFIPTGNLLDVTNTPFDFRSVKIIKEGINQGGQQIHLVGNGYDHPFMISENHNQEILLEEKESGRILTVETDEPCVVVYTGNQLASSGKIGGVPMRKHLGICLETQGAPDAVHHPNFPSIILEKGEEYNSITKYRLGILNTQVN